MVVQSGARQGARLVIHQRRRRPAFSHDLRSGISPRHPLLLFSSTPFFYPRFQSPENLAKSRGVILSQKLIFVLENDPARIEAMKAALALHELESVSMFIDNSPDAVVWLSRNLPRCGLISLDHDLGGEQIRDGQMFDPGTGRDIACYLAERSPVCQVIIHTDNFFIRPRMQNILDSGNWTHTYVSPGNSVAWVCDDWLPKVLNLFGSDGA